MEQEAKKKIKETIRKIKEKKEKQKESKESKRSHSESKKEYKREIESKKNPGSTKPVLVGPKGGEYTQADTGGRYYLQGEKTRTFHRVKKSIEVIIKDLVKSVVEDNEITKFINKFKLEKTKKFKQCVSDVKASGKPEANAYAICTSSLGSKEAHPKSDKNKKNKKE